MITREFNLYLHAGHSIPLVINANQYDRGEQWLFTLFNSDGTKYVPSSGAIVGIKSDNLGIINTGSVDAQGRVVINETQQMTAAVGKAVFELLIDDQSHGTANFIVLVEPKPGDNADLSESDLSLIQQAIDGTSATAIAQGVSDWMDENLTPTTPPVDASLTVSGAAADSAKVGQELSDLKSQINDIEEQIDGGIGGLTTRMKNALLRLAEAVTYEEDDTGDSIYDELYEAFYEITAIRLNTNSLSFSSLGATQQLTATTTPEGGAVTWASSDTSIATVDQTGLVTSVAYGTVTITATAGSVSATCNVVVASATVTSLSAVYSQDGKTVYDTASLNSLKADLVVTAHWSNGTITAVDDADYSLSGTLSEGTSTVTVSYGGKTATFDVIVTALLPSGYTAYNYLQGDGVGYIDTGLAGKTYCLTSYEHEIKYSTAVADTLGMCIYGYRWEWGNTNHRAVWIGSSVINSVSAVWCGTAARQEYSSVNDIVTIRTTRDKGIYLNGTLIGTGTANFSANHDGNIPLFCECTKGNGAGYIAGSGNEYYGAFSKARIYEFIVKDSNDAEIAHMYPAMRNSDNAVGMYDIVRNQFFANARDTGTLTLGND